ncbi:BID domain-containing T4SS effector [Bartonella rattaustraliani]|uniref:BID domain-containing T4SS effector n=1 Tax=Bartonella rattaustraliani TaxID=481139 RepID=UPI0002D2F40B|nr:BID domain-containing T4SS effector [Bartonella rattaustraliani]
MPKAKTKTRHLEHVPPHHDPSPRNSALENQQESAKVLIPKETLAPLTQEELAAMMSTDLCVSTCKKQIQKLTKRVYGSEKTLNKEMNLMNKNPEIGAYLATKIERSPHSVSSLAGFDLICFKSQARAEAEEHIETLCAAVLNYSSAVKNAKKEITREHQAEQTRRGKAVEMPSKDLQNLLSLSEEQRREILSQSPKLQQELRTLSKQINGRLSSNDHQAIKNSDYTKLAQNMGISEQKAETMAQTIQQVKAAHQQSQTIKTHRTQTLAIAS